MWHSAFRDFLANYFAQVKVFSSMPKPGTKLLTMDLGEVQKLKRVKQTEPGQESDS
jgi:hypothetical protein